MHNLHASAVIPTHVHAGPGCSLTRTAYARLWDFPPHRNSPSHLPPNGSGQNRSGGTGDVLTRLVDIHPVVTDPVHIPHPFSRVYDGF